ncbi:protein of unknown function [Candidatus Nitrosocosmicus franklandus]|uniref:Uncharacterized protein n=1 Tax=Candidatus Nitrosocosmicus franklandianus TaxID=1798806 RepID=A0A484IA35_9ARCH|nr:protein of unknown function [Candidatus Nitrosocosmicus franklandus]
MDILRSNIDHVGSLFSYKVTKKILSISKALNYFLIKKRHVYCQCEMFNINMNFIYRNVYYVPNEPEIWIKIDLLAIFASMRYIIPTQYPRVQ